MTRLNVKNPKSTFSSVRSLKGLLTQNWLKETEVVKDPGKVSRENVNNRENKRRKY